MISLSLLTRGENQKCTSYQYIPFHRKRTRKIRAVMLTISKWWGNYELYSSLCFSPFSYVCGIKCTAFTHRKKKDLYFKRASLRRPQTLIFLLVRQCSEEFFTAGFFFFPFASFTALPAPTCSSPTLASASVSGELGDWWVSSCCTVLSEVVASWGLS